jgi:hypothetical protein
LTPTASETLTSTPTATPTPSATSTTPPTLTRTPAPIVIPSITGFTLIDANADTEVRTIADGDLLNMPTSGIVAFNIRVLTSGTVGSVRIQFGAFNARVENCSPYTAFGDLAGDYFGMVITPGLFSITAQAFTGGNATGSAGQAVTIWISIAENVKVPTPVSAGALAGNVPAPSVVFCNAQWLLVSEKCL